VWHHYSAYHTKSCMNLFQSCCFLIKISGASSGFLHKKYFSQRHKFGGREEVINYGYFNLRVTRKTIYKFYVLISNLKDFFMLCLSRYFLLWLVCDWRALSQCLGGRHTADLGYDVWEPQWEEEWIVYFQRSTKKSKENQRDWEGCPGLRSDC
jgi:hypothetical protein